VTLVNSDSLAHNIMIETEEGTLQNNYIETCKALLNDVKIAGSYRRYVQAPRAALMRLRTLCARGRATPPPGDPVLERLFAAPPVADAKKGWETMENALDVQALRDLKMLYDEGVLTAAEFAAKKAMVLGTPPAAAASSNGAGPSSSTAPSERGTRRASRLRLASRPLPNDVVWHIFSFWRTSRDADWDENYESDSGDHDYGSRYGESDGDY